jgi:hypothetical protein
MSKGAGAVGESAQALSAMQNITEWRSVDDRRMGAFIGKSPDGWLQHGRRR